MNDDVHRLDYSAERSIADRPRYPAIEPNPAEFARGRIAMPNPDHTMAT
jgi:hypothetical protein